MADPFAKTTTRLSDPAYNGLAITPNDGADLPTHVRAIYVGTGGTLSVVTAGGDTLSFVNLANGQTLVGWRIARVNATGTTATDLVGAV